MRYVIYENNGKIKWTATGAKPELFCLNGEDYITSETNVSDKTHYMDLTVSPPVIKNKLPFPAVANKTEVIADNTDEVIISRVPLGCTCTLDGEPVTITEELITFTAEHVGTYVFNFSMFPYLDGTITITGKAKDENTGS